MHWIETVMGFLMIFGCGLGICLFGIWAGKQRLKPLGFWANGKPLEPASVTDISGYNREYGRLFCRYSVACMLSGIALPFFAMVSLVILVLWGIFGTWWLIHSYKKIEKRYILQ